MLGAATPPPRSRGGGYKGFDAFSQIACFAKPLPAPGPAQLDHSPRPEPHRGFWCQRHLRAHVPLRQATSRQTLNRPTGAAQHTFSTQASHTPELNDSPMGAVANFRSAFILMSTTCWIEAWQFCRSEEHTSELQSLRHL